MVPVMAVEIRSVKQKTKQNKNTRGKSFKTAACSGGVPHLIATVSLPGSGVSRDGRSGREPRASLPPRLAPSEAGVARDVPRHRGWFCTAGGWGGRNGDEVSSRWE